MNRLVIQRFIEKLRASSRTNARVINLSVSEAQDLINELTLLLLHESQLNEELKEAKRASEITELRIGGGTFNEG